MTVGCAFNFVLMILIEKLAKNVPFKVFVTLKSPSALQSAQHHFHLCPVIDLRWLKEIIHFEKP